MISNARRHTDPEAVSTRLAKGSATSTRPLLHEVTGTGDPIVLVPGILTGWASMQDLARRLAERHTVVRVQLRCIEIAESGERLRADYDVTTEFTALLATLDHLGIDRADLLGWSLGGMISVGFTLDHPERVRTLTVIEPEVPWILRETGHASEALARAEAFDRSFAGRDISVDDLRTFLVRAGLGTPDTDFSAHPRWPIMVRNRQALATIGALTEHADSLDRLRALDVPILAVRGQDSTELDRTMVGDLVDIAPHATLLELPGDHACFLEHPDAFFAALQIHIARA